MKTVGIISKLSHEKFKSIVLMPSHVSVTSWSMLLHMLSELTLDRLVHTAALYVLNHQTCMNVMSGLQMKPFISLLMWNLSDFL